MTKLKFKNVLVLGAGKVGSTVTDRKFNRKRPSIVRLFGDRTPLLR